MAISELEDVVRFGLFELDRKAAQLRRSGVKIGLAHQPLQVLSILLERPGQVVTREELRQRLWPSDVFVDFDHSLNKSIQKIREALDDSAQSPRYIETVPRSGYRLIAPVSTASSMAEPPPAKTPQASAPTIAAPSPTSRSKPSLWWTVIAACVVGLLLVALWLTRAARNHVPRAQLLAPKYVQLTDFADSATAPALSSDGHMLAFIRGDSTFISADQIYIKVLPNGEARQLTNDSRYKYDLAFSPDGSQIAYTVIDPPRWETDVVSVLGGDPHLFMADAAGLSWLDQQQLLFSQIRSGLHLGIVTATRTREHFRELYFPSHERGMAHYSYASPDRKWALVVEMNEMGIWTPCRLISLDGSAQPRPVGPQGPCGSAAWSPDNSWMYFTAWVEGQSHLWRQQFPNGQPEQITFGPAQEEGVVVEPDGRSVITSMGTEQSAIWLHNSGGDRPLSSEGEILGPPSFSDDDKALYYLMWNQPVGSGPELFRMTVDSGKSEQVFPGVSMYAYDVSPDGKQAVYATSIPGGKSQLWLAPMDRSSVARQIGHLGDTSPHFGPRGQVIFLSTEGNTNYLQQMNQDGSGREKLAPYGVDNLFNISPGRRWVIGTIANAKGEVFAALPTQGGPPQIICPTLCNPVWSSTGKFLLLSVEAGSRTGAGLSLAIPIGPAESLAQFPPGGITPSDKTKLYPGSQLVNRSDLVPGKTPSYFAYVKKTVHRNLYRISLP